MTAQEILDQVAALPREDWVKIQTGIAELLIGQLDQNEISGIRNALQEAEAEYGRGEGMDSKTLRRHLGLP